MSLTILDTAVQREEVEKGLYRVFYRVSHGARTSIVRALDVIVSSTQAEPYKLAELLAIKYILLHTHHVGMNRTGKNLQLNVSCGAIRKAQKLQTSNKDLQHHARFLQTRFVEAIVNVARRSDWVREFSGQLQYISLNDCLDPPIKTHIGDLHITRHAVDRFCDRLKASTMDRSWRRLTKLLTTSEWRIKYPQRPLRHGKPNRTTETWSLHRDNAPPVEVVIVRNERVSRVVTVIA